MTKLDLSVEIADADVARLMTAARAVFGDSKTDAEIIEHLRQHGIGLMRQLVRDYERRVAIAQAESLEPTIEIS